MWRRGGKNICSTGRDRKSEATVSCKRGEGQERYLMLCVCACGFQGNTKPTRRVLVNHFACHHHSHEKAKRDRDRDGDGRGGQGRRLLRGNLGSSWIKRFTCFRLSYSVVGFLSCPPSFFFFFFSILLLLLLSSFSFFISFPGTGKMPAFVMGMGFRT